MSKRAHVVVLLAVLAGPACARTIPSTISPDSDPGWSPFSTDQVEVEKTVDAYFDAVDHAHYAEAFAMMGEGTKQLVSETVFSALEDDFRKRAGPLRERNLIALTWSSYPPGSMFPGLYASVDFVEVFQQVARSCGYLVLERQEGEPGFKVIRTQRASLDDLTASNFAKTHAQGDVDRFWNMMTRGYPHCHDTTPAL